MKSAPASRLSRARWPSARIATTAGRWEADRGRTQHPRRRLPLASLALSRRARRTPLDPGIDRSDAPADHHASAGVLRPDDIPEADSDCRPNCAGRWPAPTLLRTCKAGSAASHET